MGVSCSSLVLFGADDLLLSDEAVFAVSAAPGERFGSPVIAGSIELLVAEGLALATREDESVARVGGYDVWLVDELFSGVLLETTAA